MAGTPWAAYLPNGNADRVTYYLGLLVLAEAMAAPAPTSICWMPMKS